MRRMPVDVQLGEAMSLERTHKNMAEEFFPGEQVTNSVYITEVLLIVDDYVPEAALMESIVTVYILCTLLPSFKGL